MNNDIAASQETPKYDPHLVPAETGARRDREASEFMHTPSIEDDLNREDVVEADPIDTTGGYTVDKEGLLNNYAVEPEMYINEPGDLRQEQEQDAAERASELENIQEDKQGKLTMEGDRRGKGQGLI